MPRLAPKRRKTSRAVLSDAWKFFLETGQYTDLRKMFPDMTTTDKIQIYQLANPSIGYREKLRIIWEQYRAEILKTWKKPGVPWAEREFYDE
jgi:hypothetical protein